MVTGFGDPSISGFNSVDQSSICTTQLSLSDGTPTGLRQDQAIGKTFACAIEKQPALAVAPPSSEFWLNTLAKNESLVTLACTVIWLPTTFGGLNQNRIVFLNI